MVPRALAQQLLPQGNGAPPLIRNLVDLNRDFRCEHSAAAALCCDVCEVLSVFLLRAVEEKTEGD